MFAASLIAFVGLYIARHSNPIKYLANDPIQSLQQWYPHFGTLLFYLLKLLYPLQLTLFFITIACCFRMLFDDIRYNKLKYTNLFSLKNLKALAVYTCIILITLGVAEYVCRNALGIVPGIGQTQGTFRKVDTLINTIGQISDSEGIFKFDYKAVSKLEKEIKTDGSVAYSSKRENQYYGQLLNTYQEKDYLKDPSITFDFANYYRNLSVHQHLNDLETAIVEYSNHPINTEGFRSIAFRNYKTKAKKILLLGDSFTFGQAPKYLFQSFADYLLTKGLIIFNTGITSTDPPQYLLIAKEFIPKLRPDYVIVNLCLANDVYYYIKKQPALTPLLFSTNAGNLMAYSDGGNFAPSGKAAYDNIIAQTSIHAKKGILYPLYMNTAIGTVVWQFLNKMGITEAETSNTPVRNVETMSYPSCNDDLKAIKDIADSNNCKLLIIAIPSYQDTGLIQVNHFPNLLKGMEYYTPPVTMADYENKTRHYNEYGHKKHGDLILKLIQ